MGGLNIWSRGQDLNLRPSGTLFKFWFPEVTRCIIPAQTLFFDQNSVTRYHVKSRKITLIHITIQITSNP